MLPNRTRRSSWQRADRSSDSDNASSVAECERGRRPKEEFLFSTKSMCHCMGLRRNYRVVPSGDELEWVGELSIRIGTILYLCDLDDCLETPSITGLCGCCARPDRETCGFHNGAQITECVRLVPGVSDLNRWLLGSADVVRLFGMGRGKESLQKAAFSL